MPLALLILGGCYAALQFYPGSAGKDANRGQEADSRSGANQRRNVGHHLPRGVPAPTSVGRGLTEPAEIAVKPQAETTPEPAEIATPEPLSNPEPEPAQETLTPDSPAKDTHNG